jgi:hypothetical protein
LINLFVVATFVVAYRTVIGKIMKGRKKRGVKEGRKEGRKRGMKTGIKKDNNHGPTQDNVPAFVCRDRGISQTSARAVCIRPRLKW